MTASTVHPVGAAMNERADLIERDAHEYVQARLALLTLVLWLILVLLIAVPIQYSGRGRAPVILLVGFVSLVVAALPWLVYPRLVEARLRSLRSTTVDPDAPIER